MFLLVQFKIPRIEPKRSYGLFTFKFKEFEIFLWKKDAFDCAGIRAQVDCSNH